MNQAQNLPQVIFFDAVGTLFGVKGSVGDIYSQIAQKHGIEVSPGGIDRAFGRVFSQASPLAFGKLASQEIPQQEYQWWYRVTRATFEEVNVFDRFSDFELFFQELYVYFATKKPWYLYAETFDCLQKWQQKKVTLGIISNFDTRIYQVLKLLRLESYFSSITISSECGKAKPSPAIFKVALAKHDCLPANAWHIGDSLTEDYQGAKAVGIKAFLLTRDRIDLQVKNQLPNLNSLG